MNWFKAAKALFKPNNSFNGWTYKYENMGKGVQAVTITTPERQVLRPVLMPRAGYDWFKHG